VPFRYLLTGVYVHCSTQDQAVSAFISSINNLNNTYVSFAEQDAINVYITEVIGGPTGAANGQPGTVFLSENLSTSVFNHEYGHVLGIGHSWRPDGISDTPEITYEYDYNCDGDLLDIWPGGANEDSPNNQCWEYFLAQGIPAPPQLDYTGDGVIDITNPCDREPPCDDHPCCDWPNINNNIMAYNSYNECCPAYTPGQLQKMVDRLSTDAYCDYVESISSQCPPPTANIHILEPELTEVDCEFCFMLGSSMHDANYKLEFYGPSGTLAYSTGWRVGPTPGKYCLRQELYSPSQYVHGLQTGGTNTVILYIENECGDEVSESLDFVLPGLPTTDCTVAQGEPITLTGLYPNPVATNSQFTADYVVEETGYLEFWLAGGTGNPVKIGERNISVVGQFQDSFSAAAIPTGTYYFIIDLNGQIIGQTLIRI
jgi:hypothetical protein